MALPSFCHTITIDSSRSLLFIQTALHDVYLLSLINPSTPTALHTWTSGSSDLWQPVSIHDSMIFNNRLYACDWVGRQVTILDLAQLSLSNPGQWRPRRHVVPPPVAPLLPPSVLGATPTYPLFAAAPHSVWVDESVSPATMWILQESPFRNIDAVNISQVNFPNIPAIPLTIQLPSLAQTGSLVSMIPDNPNYPTASVQPSVAHHLRADGRTGYIAHQMDGIDQVDLSNPSVPMSVLASFDTTTLDGSSGTMYAWERFLGIWDVSTASDSGFVLASAGRENGFVFRVNRGRFNRFWSATPFGAGTAHPAGAHPRIIAPYGPPRVGHPFVVRDGNRHLYSHLNCVWTLHITPTPPQTAAPHPSLTGITLNIDLTSTLTGTITNSMGDDVFVLNLPPQQPIWYAQMIVEEFRKQPGGVYEETGIAAASRGAWIGICP